MQVRGSHPYYRRLNRILEQAKFDHCVERLCRKYYAKVLRHDHGSSLGGA